MTPPPIKKDLFRYGYHTLQLTHQAIIYKFVYGIMFDVRCICIVLSCYDTVCVGVVADVVSQNTSKNTKNQQKITKINDFDRFYGILPCFGDFSGMLAHGIGYHAD